MVFLFPCLSKIYFLVNFFKIWPPKSPCIVVGCYSQEPLLPIGNVFFFSCNVLLKKLGHLSYRVLHTLDLADCVLIMPFNMFHCPWSHRFAKRWTRLKRLRTRAHTVPVFPVHRFRAWPSSASFNLFTRGARPSWLWCGHRSGDTQCLAVFPFVLLASLMIIA